MMFPLTIPIPANRWRRMKVATKKKVVTRRDVREHKSRHDQEGEDYSFCRISTPKDRNQAKTSHNVNTFKISDFPTPQTQWEIIIRSSSARPRDIILVMMINISRAAPKAQEYGF